MTDEGATKPDDSLFESVRGFLIFGRFIGLTPFKGVFQKTSSHLKFKWLSAPSIISIIVTSSLIFNSTLELIRAASVPKTNAFLIAQAIRLILYYIWGTFVYVYFLLRSDAFIKIFHDWRELTLFHTKPDLKLKRDVVLITVVILVSGVLENSLLYWTYIEDAVELARGKSKKNFPNSYAIFESYYNESHQSWAKFIPFHPILAVIAFVQHKLILFAWNGVDIWIALFSRALYFKFKALCEVCEEKLMEPLSQKPRFLTVSEGIALPKTVVPTPLVSDFQGWLQMTKDHKTLCKLLKTFEDFLSPLIFISYTVNIFYLCMQLLDGLRVEIERNTWSETINRPWSFIHLILRMYLLSICCARINDYAHEIGKVINECPSEFYSTEISRLDKRVVGGRQIGLTGLGCFTVDKPFILSTLGVVFTLEMVLLQVVPDAVTQCCCNK